MRVVSATSAAMAINAAEKLNSLGDGIDNLGLLSVVFVEQQVQLIEGWSGHLPVRFLVEIPQSHGIGKQQVELLGHLQAGPALPVPRGNMCGDPSLSPHLTRTLMQTRLRADLLVIRGNIFLRHIQRPSLAMCGN